jgi:hypothetical protein
VLPTMAGSMEQECVCARVLLWRWLGKCCDMSYHECNTTIPGTLYKVNQQDRKIWWLRMTVLARTNNNLPDRLTTARSIKHENMKTLGWVPIIGGHNPDNEYVKMRQTAEPSSWVVERLL